MLPFSCGSSILLLRSVSNCFISMSFMFLLSHSIFTLCEGSLIMSILWCSNLKDNLDLVMFWIQFYSVLCIIQSRVLPVLCFGKVINWCRLNVFSISAKLWVSIWSDEFHGTLKCHSIVGWEFSFNIEVMKSENSRNVNICTGFFLEYGGLYIRAKEAWLSLTISASNDFLRLVLPFEHLNLIYWYPFSPFPFLFVHSCQMIVQAASLACDIIESRSTVLLIKVSVMMPISLFANSI